MNRYDNVTSKGERDMFGKKMGSGGGMRATDIWMWCGLCVVMLGVVGILSGGGSGRRVPRCDGGIYEDVDGNVGLSVLCSWEYPSGVEEEEIIEWDVAGGVE